MMNNTQNKPQLFMNTFFTRTDIVAVGIKGWKVPVVPATGDDRLPDLIESHLTGNVIKDITVNPNNNSRQCNDIFRVGTYSPNAEGKTKYLCFDLDGKGHASNLLEIDLMAIWVRATCERLEVYAYLEKSGGGNGYHIWIIFESLLSAKKARDFARRIIEDIPEEYRKTSSGFADGLNNQGVEIFPKSDSLNSSKGVGSMVWLPLWSGAPDGANNFLRITKDDEFEPYFPEKFDTVIEEQLDDALLALDNEQGCSVNDANASYDNEKHESDTDKGTFKKWREEALSKLSLSEIYGEALVEEIDNDGWYKARDLDSPTKDKNPSAGIATGSGKAERGSFHSFITSDTESVFNYMIRRKQAKDFNDARRIVADLSGVPLPKQEIEQTHPMDRIAERRGKRSIIVSDQLSKVKVEAEQALAEYNNPPKWFIYRNRLVELAGGDDDQPKVKIKSMPEGAIINLLAECENWKKEMYIKDEYRKLEHVTAYPPKEVIKILLQSPNSLAKAFPVLEKIVYTPFFACDGVLYAESGYIAEHKTYVDYHLDYHLKESLPIKQHPDKNEIKAAINVVMEELFGDIPFADETNKISALAALLTPLVREIIDGPVPLFLITSPKQGTGKDLLGRIIERVHYGRESGGTTLPSREDQVRSQIQQALIRQQPILRFSNLPEKKIINSASLATVLTEKYWKIFSRGETSELKINMVFIATGNNTKISSDLLRRVLPIRLDANVARPYLRNSSDFKIPDMDEYLSKNRGNIIWALIQLVNNWISNGKSLCEKPFGNFEHWSGVIGGILEAARIQGFLDNMEQYYDEADIEQHEWSDFIEEWWQTYKDKKVSATQLNTLSEDNNLMPEIRGIKKSGQAQKLGKALASMKDKIISDKKIFVKAKKKDKGNQYYLKEIKA